MNRKAIRNTLTSYKEAKRQQEAILKDKEIQKLFTLEKEEEARKLISIKYPIGDFRNVNKMAISLIEEMVKGIPAWKGIDPMDVYTDLKIFEDLLDLAERV